VTTQSLLHQTRDGFRLSDDETLLDMPKIFQLLCDVFVDSDFRGLGIGTWLAEANKYWAAKNGTSALFWLRVMRTESIRGPGLNP
jgi:GNAT superfamily N-acetyltransferase